MKTRITIEQLEQMKTHELADLLGNVAMLLRRMPDVPCSELIQPIPADDVFMQEELPQQSLPAVHFTEAELKKKTTTLPYLKKIADSLFISYPSNIKKADLISKILDRAASGRSEQYAIQNL